MSEKPFIQITDKDIELLERYTKFLQKNGYIDSDATSEEPYALDEFIKQERKNIREHFNK